MCFRAVCKSTWSSTRTSSSSVQHQLTWVAENPGFCPKDDVGLLVLVWELPYFRTWWLKIWGPWEGEELLRIGLVGGGGPGGPESLAFWCQLQWFGCGCLWSCWEILSTLDRGINAYITGAEWNLSFAFVAAGLWWKILPASGAEPVCSVAAEPLSLRDFQGGLLSEVLPGGWWLVANLGPFPPTEHLKN